MQVLFHVERPTGLPGRHLNQIPNEPNGQGEADMERAEANTELSSAKHATPKMLLMRRPSPSCIINSPKWMASIAQVDGYNRSSKETPMLRRKPPIDDDDDLMTNRNRTEKKKRREVAIAERAVKSN